MTLRDRLFWEGLKTRNDMLYSNVPRCSACNHEQVQIISHENPAQWKCRICKHKFMFEPCAS